MISALRHQFSLAGQVCGTVKKWLVDVLSALLGINGILMVLVATLQIVSRLLGNPVAWTVELLLFLGLYSILPGAALIFLKSEEIEVSFIVNLLPRPFQIAVECFTSAVCIAYGMLLFISNVNYSYLVNLGVPEQFLPFPPVVNILPVYLLAFAIFWDMLRKLKETIFGTTPKMSGLKETELQ